MDRVSRRQAIGGTVGGAAAIWAAPIVTTVGLIPAAAASGSIAESWSIDADRPRPNVGWNNQLITGTVPVDQTCVTVTALTGNTPQMVGLNSDPNTNASYATIDFAIYIYSYGTAGILRFYIYESGAYGGYWTNIAIGDEVCVTRDPTTGAVTYSINGTVVYTSSNTSTATMYVDSSFYYTAGFWNGSISLDITSC